MNFIARVGAIVALAAVAAPAASQDNLADRIAWSQDLPTALEEARSSNRILMVCINAKYVDGRDTEERAAKGLREVVYLDERVVKRSRDFVCVLLTKKGSSTEYDTLRDIGVQDPIISPQHLFVSPDGLDILEREEYWSYGKGEVAVSTLLQLMRRAEEALANGGGGLPPDEPEKPADEEPVDDTPKSPQEGADRAKWIADRIARVSDPTRDPTKALEDLIDEDKDGDCTGPLIELIPENEKNDATLSAIVRALGVDGLEAAALPIADILKHKNELVVADAAVSLEYIGSADKKVIGALKKAAGKIKDEKIANHAYRALGRCGANAGDSKARSTLLKQAGSAKSELASYGAIIGLAYYEGDSKAMRGVEELLKQIGVPGGRRGGGGNIIKRGLVSWTLASIGDVKSAEFMREEMLHGLKNVKAFWVEGLRNFWETVAEVCDGEKDRLGEVEGGLGGFVAFGGRGIFGDDSKGLMDDARSGRDTSKFEPKGDGILQGRGD